MTKKPSKKRGGQKSSRQYSVRELKILFALSGNRCAFPGCKNTVIEPATDESDYVVVGEISHIVASSDRGSRGDSSVGLKNRDSIENLLLLCGTHHVIVDGQPNKYTVSELRKWKAEQQSASFNISDKSIVPLDALPIHLIDAEVGRSFQMVQKTRFLREREDGLRTQKFAKRVIDGDLSLGSASVRAYALSFCARYLAPFNEILAREILDTAVALDRNNAVRVAERVLRDNQETRSQIIDELIENEGELGQAAATGLKARDTDSNIFEWLSSNGISLNDAMPDTKAAISAFFLQRPGWDSFESLFSSVSSADMDDAPFLHIAKGYFLLGKTVTVSDKTVLIGNLSYELGSFPLSSEVGVSDNLESAASVFLAGAKAFRDYGVEYQVKYLEDLALMCRLLNPATKSEAVEELRESIKSDETLIRRLSFAIDTGVAPDRLQVRELLERRLSGSASQDNDALAALFFLISKDRDRKRSSSDLQINRDRLRKAIRPEILAGAEIGALLDVDFVNDAKVRLSEWRALGLEQSEADVIETTINAAAAGDQTSSFMDAYQQTGELVHLQNAFLSANRQQGFETIASIGKILFEAQGTASVARKYIVALRELSRFSEVEQFFADNPGLIEQDPTLKIVSAEASYLCGDIASCLSVLNSRTQPDDNEEVHDLRVAATIASGDWSKLYLSVEHSWEKRDDLEVRALLKAADLAQRIDHPHSYDLARSAVEGDPKNPAVLIAAYQVAIALGREDSEEVGKWLRGAIRYSPADGPIKSITLDEVIKMQPEWRERSERIETMYLDGQLPAYLAAEGLNQSLGQRVLLPLLRNPSESDVRLRVPVPLFFGQKREVPTKLNSIMLDPSALLVLGSLARLDAVIKAFDRVWIPHATMHWLIEERQAIKFHQPSELRRMQRVRSLISDGKLQTIANEAPPDWAMANEVGETLALLISNARIPNCRGCCGYVIHPNPVYRVSTSMKQEAQLGDALSAMRSCSAVVRSMVEYGLIGSAKSKEALQILAHRENEWPNEQTIARGSTIYVDSLSVRHFEDIGLLDKLHTGFEVLIDPAEVENTQSLSEYEELSNRALQILDGIQKQLAAGIRTGAVVLAKAPESQQENGTTSHPAVGVAEVPVDSVNVIVSDDRFVNRYKQWQFSDASIPIISSLETLETLRNRKIVTFEECCRTRDQIRSSGVFFVPLDADELLVACANCRLENDELILSAELRAIEASLVVARMRARLISPDEVAWFVELQRVIADTVGQLWEKYGPCNWSTRVSQKLIEFADPLVWVECGKLRATQSNIDLFRASWLGMLRIFQFKKLKTQNAYYEWLDNEFISPLSRSSPTSFRVLIDSAASSMLEVFDRQAAESLKVSDREGFRVAARNMLFRTNTPTIRAELIKRKDLVEQLELKVGPIVKVKALEASFPREEFHLALRRAFRNRPSALEDTAGRNWRIVDADASIGDYSITNGRKTIRSAGKWMLVPKSAIRLARIDEAHEHFGLGDEVWRKWRKVLSKRVLNAEETRELIEIINSRPLFVQQDIRNNAQTGDELVPAEEQYYLDFLGEPPSDGDIELFFDTTLRKQIEELIARDRIEGTIVSLRFGLHSMVASILPRDITADEFHSVVESLSNPASPFEKLMLFEYGVFLLKEGCKIIDDLRSLFEEIRTIPAVDYETYVTLWGFVETLFLHNNVHQSCAPAWRRLASGSHANFLFGFDPSDDFLEFAEQEQLIRLMRWFADLRVEPRWLPIWLNSEQLRLEIMSRLLAATFVANEHLTSGGQDTFDTDGIVLLEDFFRAFKPGPLEGVAKPYSEPPAGAVEKLQERLGNSSAMAAELSDVLNLIGTFEIPSEFANTLRNKLLELTHGEVDSLDDTRFMSLMGGWAWFSLRLRDVALAEEARVRVRRRRRLGIGLERIDLPMQIGLITAAANKSPEDWAISVGDWFTDASFDDLSGSEARWLREAARVLAAIEPTVWEHIGKALAAFDAIIAAE